MTVIGSLEALIDEINLREKFCARIVDSGVMQITTKLETHKCPRCNGTGEVQEFGDVVVERVCWDGGRVIVNGVTAGDADSFLRSLHAS